MPIAGIGDVKLDEQPKVISTNDVQPTNFNNNVVVDGYGSDISKYIKYIDGNNLEVDYYSFIRDINTETTLLDPNDTTQQYIQVKQLLLKTTATLQEATNYDALSIDAVLDANIIPAENDICVLRLPNGLVGLFRVSITEKRTYITRKIYDIKLTFLYFKHANIDYYDNLISKVKKVYVYDKNYIATNSAPLLLESTYRDKREALVTLDELSRAYLDMFIHNKIISCLDNGVRIYDANIMKLIKEIIGETHYDRVKFIESDSDSSVIDAIMNKKKSFKNINRYYESVLAGYDIAFSHTTSLISGYIDRTIHTTATEASIVPRGLSVSSIIPNNFRTLSSNLYLFTNAFYDGGGGLEELSLLENNIVKFVNNELLVYSELQDIIDDIPNWSTIEAYNYIPLVLLLLSYFKLNTYDRI